MGPLRTVVVARFMMALVSVGLDARHDAGEARTRGPRKTEGWLIRRGRCRRVLEMLFGRISPSADPLPVDCHAVRVLQFFLDLMFCPKVLDGPATTKHRPVVIDDHVASEGQFRI